MYTLGASVSIAERLLEELRRRKDLRDALAQELLSSIFKDRRLRLAILTTLYRDIATKQDLKELREEIYKIREGLGGETNELRGKINELGGRVDTLFRWMVGLILGMWISVMPTLIPILLKLLGAI